MSPFDSQFQSVPFRWFYFNVEHDFFIIVAGTIIIIVLMSEESYREKVLV